MPAISITFSAPAKPHFQWYDSFEELTDSEVTEFAFLCRNATAAFFSEVTERRNPYYSGVEKHYTMLHQNANQINDHGITKVHEANLKDFELYMVGPADSQDKRRDRQLARQFLWSISRVTHWSHVLLILCTLGKHKLQQLNDGQRVKLLKYIVRHGVALFCPKLEDRAAQYNLYQTSTVL